jgi:hypothetical protein
MDLLFSLAKPEANVELELKVKSFFFNVVFCC